MQCILGYQFVLKEGVACPMFKFPLGVAGKIGDIKLFKYVLKQWNLNVYVFIKNKFLKYIF